MREVFQPTVASDTEWATEFYLRITNSNIPCFWSGPVRFIAMDTVYKCILTYLTFNWIHSATRICTANVQGRSPIFGKTPEHWAAIPERLGLDIRVGLRTLPAKSYRQVKLVKTNPICLQVPPKHQPHMLLVRDGEKRRGAETVRYKQCAQTCAPRRLTESMIYMSMANWQIESGMRQNVVCTRRTSTICIFISYEFGWMDTD